MAANDASRGRLLIGPLAFAVSPDERARLALVPTIDGPSVRTRPINIVIGIVALANGVLQMLTALDPLGLGTTIEPFHLTFAIGWLILSLVYFFGLVRTRPNFSRSRLSGDGERTFARYEEGLAFERPTSLVPWSRVRAVYDLGDLFIVRTTLRRRILPKRIFDDGGDAFWSYAAGRIVSGGRMLVVPANRRVLRNSAYP